MKARSRFHTGRITNQMQMITFSESQVFDEETHHYAVNYNNKMEEMEKPQTGWLIQSEEGDIAVCAVPFKEQRQIQVFTEVWIQCNTSLGPCSLGEACDKKTPSITDGIPDKFCTKGEHGKQHWHIVEGASWI